MDCRRKKDTSIDQSICQQATMAGCLFSDDEVAAGRAEWCCGTRRGCEARRQLLQQVDWMYAADVDVRFAVMAWECSPPEVNCDQEPMRDCATSQLHRCALSRQLATTCTRWMFAKSVYGRAVGKVERNGSAPSLCNMERNYAEAPEAATGHCESHSSHAVLFIVPVMGDMGDNGY